MEWAVADVFPVRTGLAGIGMFPEYGCSVAWGGASAELPEGTPGVTAWAVMGPIAVPTCVGAVGMDETHEHGVTGSMPD